MMKKMIRLGVMLTLVVSLSACSGNIQFQIFDKEDGIDISEKKDIEVVEIEKYEEYIEETSNYPVVVGISIFELRNMKNEKLQAELNNAFKKEANELIDHWKGIREEAIVNGYGIDFQHLITRNDEKIFTLCVRRNEENSREATYYNINKETGELMKLEDFYGENENYRDYISSYVFEKAQELAKKEGFTLWVDKPESIKDALDNFYINENDNVVISFHKYSIAVGAMGIVEVELEDDLDFSKKLDGGEDKKNTNKEEVKVDESKKIIKSIVGEWEPTKAREGHMEISLQNIWGSSIKYGGTLKIYEDGRYTEYIGVFDEEARVTCEVQVKNKKIKLKSKLNEEKEVTIVNENLLDINYDGRTVRFRKIVGKDNVTASDIVALEKFALNDNSCSKNECTIRKVDLDSNGVNEIVFYPCVAELVYPTQVSIYGIKKDGTMGKLVDNVCGQTLKVVLDDMTGEESYICYERGADGLCYIYDVISKIEKNYYGSFYKELFLETCDSEAEEKHREELRNTLTEEEYGEEIFNTHISKYKVNGAEVTKAEYDKALKEFGNSHTVLKTIDFYELFNS